ncbi:hypothetical protein [Pseudoxanthomonas sacheonensis]|uniref:Membrane protein n=1 Tax=Pseudoxanthomonas sacheonensis TaxID=443615 RepID=A0ABU1RS68_9GAMM|nr:hypothetical protein [Pseudoxanthomonas sacheonensis]MDR6840949.1 putative membrane protein [Pseudoxanthomonas sacheonensis]
MSWLGMLLIVLGIYLALKVAGFALKLALWVLVIAGVYWLLAPYLGLPVPF